MQVGQIRDVKIQGKSNQIRLQVAWFYRPEDAAGGRKVRGFVSQRQDVGHLKLLRYTCTLGTSNFSMVQLFHGEKELLKSEHLDWCSASTIEGKCRVHSLQSYQVQQI